MAGWLAWDIGDHGSARTWYGAAVKAARSSGDRLLAAYQLGSLGQFEAHVGNAAQGLSLVQQARRQLTDRPMAIATAWLLAIEALAYATSGDRKAADLALVESARSADRVAAEASPPWPWVFAFTPTKVAAARLSCGARLGLPEWVTAVQDEAAQALASGHEKQRALLMLDLAAGYLAGGKIDGAFSLATRALQTGVRYRSGRIVGRAREIRRAYPSVNPPKVIRDFDDRLHDVYL